MFTLLCLRTLLPLSSGQMVQFEHAKVENQKHKKHMHVVIWWNKKIITRIESYSAKFAYRTSVRR